jgi:type II secretory pathway component PulC
MEAMELRLTDRHIMAVNVLLVGVLAYFAVLAVNDVVAFRGAPIAAPILHTQSKVADDFTANRTRAAYQAIVERDIFNLEPPPPPPAAPVVVEDLHLTLIGVTETSKGKPYAIFADRTGEQSVYRVGEIIPGSGKLLEVTKDRAIVEHGGKHVALELPKDNMSGDDSGDETVAQDGDLSPAEASSRDQAHHRLMRHRRRP